MNKVYRKIVPMAAVSIGDDIHYIIDDVKWANGYKTFYATYTSYWNSTYTYFRKIETDEMIRVTYLHDAKPIFVEWLGVFDCYPSLREGEKLYDANGNETN